MQDEVLWASLLARYRAGEVDTPRKPVSIPISYSYQDFTPDWFARPVLLVSACLLGYAVSYRGACAMCARPQAAPSPANFILRVLAQRAAGSGGVTCVPLCPEVQLLGLSVPRSPLRLVRHDSGNMVDTVDTSTSHSLFTMHTHDDLSALLTQPLHSSKQQACSMNKASMLLPPCKVTRRTLRIVQHTLPLYIDGVLLKARSPCCGVGDARVYHDNNDFLSAYTLSDGCFTSALRQSLQQHPTHSTATASLPPLVITSERLLRSYEPGPSPVHSLPTFLAHVRAHYEARRALHAAYS